MIVMPGAWRCEQHRLWTNSDCPDCDADLIASHEGQDEDMSAPLTTRDAIVRALAEHDWRAADDFDWSRPCRHADHQFSAFCAVCSGDLGLMADALLASGALTDATKLAEEVARIRQWLWKASQGDHTRIREAGIMQEACAQLDAALSAPSERAEVER